MKNLKIIKINLKILRLGFIISIKRYKTNNIFLYLIFYNFIIK